MKSLLHSHNKKGLSAVVGYVLLISMGIALSIIVYNWLSNYIEGTDIPECSENVNLIIDDYYCQKDVVPGDKTGFFNYTLKNKGLFTVDGFLIRVHDREDATLGYYLIDETGTQVLPGDIYKSTSFVLGDLTEVGTTTEIGLTSITFLEVQPFIYEEEINGPLNCKSTLSQKIECT